MLHLDAGVHFDKVVIAVLVHQKFQCAGIFISHMFGDFYGICIQFLAYFPVHGEGGGELYDFLIPPLERAVPFVQMHHIAILVAQDLHLDVFGVHQVLLHENVIVSESFACLGLYQIEVDPYFLYGVAAAHTPPTAAGGSFQNDGESEFHGQTLCLFPAFQRFRGAGSGGDTAGQCNLLCRQFVAHHVQNLGRGADELNAGLFTGTGKIAVFAQKTIAGVNGIGSVQFGKLNDSGNIQVGTQRAFIFPNQIGFVRRSPEGAVHILVGINSDGLQAQIMACAENPHGNLAAVCYQYFLKRFAHGKVLLFPSEIFPVCTNVQLG